MLMYHCELEVWALSGPTPRWGNMGGTACTSSPTPVEPPHSTLSLIMKPGMTTHVIKTLPLVIAICTIYVIRHTVNSNNLKRKYRHYIAFNWYVETLHEYGIHYCFDSLFKENYVYGRNIIYFSNLHCCWCTSWSSSAVHSCQIHLQVKSDNILLVYISAWH